MLTARTDEMDVVVGLEAGADDYLTKPVRLAELHARIRAHLRRDAAAPADEQAAAPIGDLLVDPAARRVTVAGVEVPMRAKEFDLLARLAAEPDRAVSRETLMADVWDENWFGSTKTLDVHVAAVRRKLADAADGADAGCPRSSPCAGTATGSRRPAARGEGLARGPVAAVGVTGHGGSAGSLSATRAPRRHPRRRGRAQSGR